VQPRSPAGRITDFAARPTFSERWTSAGSKTVFSLGGAKGDQRGFQSYRCQKRPISVKRDLRQGGNPQGGFPPLICWRECRIRTCANALCSLLFVLLVQFLIDALSGRRGAQLQEHEVENLEENVAQCEDKQDSQYDLQVRHEHHLEAGDCSAIFSFALCFATDVSCYQVSAVCAKQRTSGYRHEFVGGDAEIVCCDQPRCQRDELVL